MGLRPYQRDFLDHLRKDKRRALICAAPTGAGKTIIAAEIAADRAHSKVWMVVHLKTLARQGYDAMLARGLKARYVQGMYTHATEHDVLVGMIQTLKSRDDQFAGIGKEIECRCPINHRPDCVDHESDTCKCKRKCRQHLCVSILEETFTPRQLKGVPDYLIVDEAHIGNKYGLRLVRAVLAKGGKVVGLTATPSDTGWMGAYYEDIITVETTKRLVDDKYLVPPRAVMATPIFKAGDAKGHDADGEYTPKQMRAMLPEEGGEIRAQVIGDIPKEWIKFTNERYGGAVPTLITVPSIALGDEVREMMVRATGLRWEVCSSRDGRKDRSKTEDLLDGFRDGRIVGLISPIKLSLGFDAPHVRCLVLARPYARPSTMIQAVGRALRPFEGKDDALIIDHGTNFIRHADKFIGYYHAGPRTLGDIKDDREIIWTKCPGCGVEYRGRPSICLACQYDLSNVGPREEDVQGTVAYYMKALDLASPESSTEHYLKDNELLWREISAYAKQKAAKESRPPAYASNYARYVHFIMTTPVEHLFCMRRHWAVRQRMEGFAGKGCRVPGLSQCFPRWTNNVLPLADVAPGNMARPLFRRFIIRSKMMSNFGEEMMHVSEYQTGRCAVCHRMRPLEDFENGIRGYIAQCRGCRKGGNR